MPKLKLTAAAVERLKSPEKGQVEYFDVLQPAFGLRISYSGTKSWIALTRVGGKLVRYTLGRYPTMSLATARNEARTALQKAAAGIDLREEKRKAKDKEAAIAADTFGARVSDFLEKHVDPRLRDSTRGEYRRVLRTGDLAKWHDRPITSITKRDVIALLDDIAHRGTPASAKTTFAYLRKFMNWCVDREILEQSPTDRIKAPETVKARDRTLNEQEITCVWKASERGHPTYSAFIKILLLTGQRRGEVAGMRWDELSGVDSSKALWTIPSERTKNGRAHMVPLSRHSTEILQSLPRIGPFVFSTNGASPISGFSKFKRQLDNKIAEELKRSEVGEISQWRLHDLRRTTVTMMNEKLGIAPHIVEAVVNHQSGLAKAGVAGVYNRALYLDERRKALANWSDFLSNRIGEAHGR